MKAFLGPPGACDACCRCCGTLDQVGIPCYYCHQGVFMHRRWWRFWEDEYGQWFGVPREDIDPAELEVERREMEARQAAAKLPRGAP